MYSPLTDLLPRGSPFDQRQTGTNTFSNAFTRKGLTATPVPWPEADALETGYRFQPGFPPQGVEIALTDTLVSDFGRPSAP